MIEISPKIIAPNYLYFMVSNIKNSKSTNPKSWLKWYVGAVVLSFFTMLMSARAAIIAMPILERFLWSLIVPFAFMLLVAIILIPIAYFFTWPKKYIYEDSQVRIVRGKSSTIIAYSNFTKIVLDSKYSAALHFKNSGMFPVITTGWYGLTQEDWLNFILFLRTRIEDLDMHIGVVTGRGVQDPGTPCSAEEAYTRVQSL